MSTAACGIGINLTAANRCIIYESNWNPALLNQAVSRIYRLGQKRNCFIYRFVGHGCMEEQIYKKAVLKESLSLSVIDKYQIKRHFDKLSKDELYKFDYKRSEPNKRVANTNVNIKGAVLKGFLWENVEEWLVDFHDHEDFLSNSEAGLSEAEKASALSMNDRNSINFYDCENLIFGESSESEEEESHNNNNTTKRKLDEIPNSAKASNRNKKRVTKKRVTTGNEIVLEERVVNDQNIEPNTVQHQHQCRLPIHSKSHPGFIIDLNKLIEKEMDLDTFVKKHASRGVRCLKELMKSWGETYGDGWEKRLEDALRYEKSDYFLKLVNKNGSMACYANVVVQAMISLGHDFYELVCILSLGNLSNLGQLLYNYIF